jgi:TPR repeat protein
MVLAARAAEARRAIAVETFHAQRGLPRFQYLLGLRYLAGDGLDRDPKAARFWLAQAAARGDVNATRALASLATEKTRDQRR